MFQHGFQESIYTRAPAAMLAAFLVTCGLFFIMYSMIRTTAVLRAKTEPITITWVKPMEMEEVQVVDKSPVKPPEPEVPPAQPRIKVTTPGDFSELPRDLVTDPAIDRTFSTGLVDGTVLPIVRVQPPYPRQALARGIEGFTIVEFDVWTDGSVRNAQVIDRAPSSVFDNASLQAIAKFRYKPQVENGKPVIVTGMQNRFTFELDQGRQ